MQSYPAKPRRPCQGRDTECQERGTDASGSRTKTMAGRSTGQDLAAGGVTLQAGITQKTTKSLPYTLPGSASDRLAAWLGSVSVWWQQAEPWIGTSLWQLALGTLFSLTVAAHLGQRVLVLTAALLLVAWVRASARGRWAYSALVSVSLPLGFAWLIGHATHAVLHPASVLIAACFAITLYGCSHIDRTGAGLLRQVLPQVVAVASIVVIQQPVTAAVVALLGSAQVLWATLLQTPDGRGRYFRATQLPLTLSMLLTALALGYGA